MIDGGGSRNSCISAVYVHVSYITINGFECRNTVEYGINFNAGSALAGIVIENNYVHDTGPGAYAGGSGAFDDGNYRNQINFEIDSTLTGVASGVQILNNTVVHSGGHNAIEVHHDEGGPVVRGNHVSGGCVHGCIDLKGVINALVDQNVVTNPDGSANAPGFYTENTFIPQESITFSRNIVYDTPVGMQVESGTSSSYPCDNGACNISAAFYNNTIYEPSSSYSLISTSCSAANFTFTVENNIIDGGKVDMHSGCNIAWNYNDDGGSQGLSVFDINDTNYTAAYGANDLYDANPLFVAATNNPPNFALKATSPCLYAGTDVGLAYTGPAPSMGAIDPNVTATPTPTPSSTPTATPAPNPTATPAPTPVSAQALSTFISPSDGATVSGTVAIRTSQAPGVSWTNVYVDGAWIASEPPFSFKWNSASVANGSHTLTVTSYTSSNAILASSSISVNVRNHSEYRWW